MAAKTEMLISQNYDRQHRNSNGQLGVLDHDQLEESVFRLLRQRPTTENGNVAGETGNTSVSYTHLTLPTNREV